MMLSVLVLFSKQIVGKVSDTMFASIFYSAVDVCRLLKTMLTRERNIYLWLIVVSQHKTAHHFVILFWPFDFVPLRYKLTSYCHRLPFPTLELLASPLRWLFIYSFSFYILHSIFHHKRTVLLHKNKLQPRCIFIFTCISFDTM